MFAGRTLKKLKKRGRERTREEKRGRDKETKRQKDKETKRGRERKGEEEAKGPFFGNMNVDEFFTN